MKLGRLAPLAGVLVATVFAFPGLAQAPRVLQVDLDHVIHPLSVEIVSSAVRQAERDGAAALLIRLNTPGGLLSATQEIIQLVVTAPTPVITYVAPSGGGASSAGFMILMAGDVAVMAPGTKTGAAHPVVLGGGEMDPVMKKKVENDAAAAVRAVTDKRGRNSELAQEAVIESRAFTEEEALESNLIELIAQDIPTLMEKLDGRTVMRFDGSEQVLNLKDAVVYPYELTYRQRLLLPLVDPGLAFIVLALGMLGLYIEFSNPGLILPGVAGAILAILGLMALSVLPINWAGVALILTGLACFLLEATITSGGIFAAGGALAMVLGAVMLVDTDVPELSIGWGTAIAVTLPFAVITVFLLRLAVKSFSYKVATGSESMVGEIGIAKTDIHDGGRIFVHGEWWNAEAAEPIPQGTKVRVIGVDGLRLKVEPVDEMAEKSV